MDMHQICDLCKPIVDYLKSMDPNVEIRITDDRIQVMTVELSIPVKE